MIDDKTFEVEIEKLALDHAGLDADDTRASWNNTLFKMKKSFLAGAVTAKALLEKTDLYEFKLNCELSAKITTLTAQLEECKKGLELIGKPVKIIEMTNRNIVNLLSEYIKIARETLERVREMEKK